MAVVNHMTAGRGGERECVYMCVYVYVRLRASCLTMGVTARFVKGVVLETEEGTRTESKRRWAVFLHTGSGPGSEVIYKTSILCTRQN